MGRPRPLRLDEVRVFEYVKVEKKLPEREWWDHWGEITPIVPCSRCGQRMARDPMRDEFSGELIPDEAFPF